MYIVTHASPFSNMCEKGDGSNAEAKGVVHADRSSLDKIYLSLDFFF